MSGQPPYQRISAELRRRIAAGELRPGDRLPSTRALATQWDVALATAAKALTELRLSGVVRTQSRVGTVVAAPRTRSASDRPTKPAPGSGSTEPATGVPAPGGSGGTATELSRERLVRAAVEIADAQGLEALSMRAVAARLGVAPMTLYRHVTSKDDLVLLMADAAYAEDDYPDPLPDGWRDRVELGARTLWRLYARHPWLAQLGPLARPMMLPNLLRHGEVVLGGLHQLGLPGARVLDLQIVLFNHGQGLAANRERETRARDDTGMSDDEWVEGQTPRLIQLAESGEYPNFSRMIGDLGGDYDFDLDALFEVGLRALLDGFERLAGSGGSPTSAGGPDPRRIDSRPNPS